MTRQALEVVSPGALALVEDLGRPGLATMGVGRGGAADRGALLAGNRLLGNAAHAAGVEATLGGLEVVVRGAMVTVAVTGADVPLTVDGQPRSTYSVETLARGSTLAMGRPERGLRSYLVVRGGIDVPAVLGSRSSDVLSGIGPEPLLAGTVLPIGTEWISYPVIDHVPTRPAAHGPVSLRVVRGPRDDWMADADELVRTTWRVESASNRIGLRLGGHTLARATSSVNHELPSEGLSRGAVQVPPSGEPVVFLADHPVTGGYPVTGVVVDSDVDRAAQRRPGDTVRFVWTS